ncbi:MAG: cupin domain-containing protein [Planctomycetales bacterium]|nr:cupin domain-containing protein [Planctomycetales bacterium]
MATCGNLFTPVGSASAEVFNELLRGGEFKLEQIVSTGQVTPTGQWFYQDTDEWVALLSGGARLLFEGDSDETVLHPGDYVNIPAHRRHRVTWTDPERETVWLALHHRHANTDVPC